MTQLGQLDIRKSRSWKLMGPETKPSASLRKSWSSSWRHKCCGWRGYGTRRPSSCSTAPAGRHEDGDEGFALVAALFKVYRVSCYARSAYARSSAVPGALQRADVLMHHHTRETGAAAPVAGGSCLQSQTIRDSGSLVELILPISCI